MFSESETVDTFTFYPDLEEANEFEERFLSKIKKSSFDYLIFMFSSVPGIRKGTLSLATLEVAKKLNEGTWIAIWGDLQIRRIAKLAFDLEYLFERYWVAGSSGGGTIFDHVVCQRLPVTKRKDLFFVEKSWESREYDVIFYGSAYRERRPVLDGLKDMGIKIKLALGGERARLYSDCEYAADLRNARICISFSRSAGCHVTNARVFEALSCGTVLIEQVGVETLRYFEPEREFLMFWHMRDLKKKIREVLDNTTYAQQLSENGYLAYKREVRDGSALVSDLMFGQHRFVNVGFFAKYRSFLLWVYRCGLWRSLGLVVMWSTNFLWWRMLSLRIKVSNRWT